MSDNAKPKRGIAVVTCMDCRLDVLAALELEPGDAHVLRNAGGVVTEDTIRSLAISQRRLGTRDVLLVHHTDCGMQALDEEGFRSELREAAGTEPPFAIGSFEEVEEDVRESVLRVRRSPFLLHRDAVRGYVYDVETHRVREIEAG
ncbi:MAG TPA: carbonic anhydrase [Solirubrobacterales bacterium]|nr:carbonic anhydrase [Solirubrobacterales bacterium]